MHKGVSVVVSFLSTEDLSPHSSTGEDCLFKFRDGFVATVSQDINVTLPLYSFSFLSLESDLVLGIGSTCL